MFGLGLPELIVIFVIALVVFGPKKLPDLGKSVGRAMAEFKKAQQEFQESVQAEMKEVEKTAKVDEIKELAKIDVSPYGEAEPSTQAGEKSAEQQQTIEQKSEAIQNNKDNNGEKKAHG